MKIQNYQAQGMKKVLYKREDFEKLKITKRGCQTLATSFFI